MAGPIEFREVMRDYEDTKREYRELLVQRDALAACVREAKKIIRRADMTPEYEAALAAVPPGSADDSCLREAAPALLSACECALALMEGESLDELHGDLAEVLRDAIARAKGDR